MASAPRRPAGSQSSGAAIEHFVSELLRWGTRPEVARAMRAEGEELSATDEWLLRRLYDVGPVRLSELAAFQGVDRSTITSQVRRLEDGGLVLRAADPDDRRAVLVRLSARGRRLHEATVARAREVLDGLVDDWPDADRAALVRLLTELTRRLTEQATRTDAD